MTDPNVSDALANFHPAVAGWFGRSFPAPTPAQARAWPLIRAGRSTLVAAPTGSGKTLTAFLAAIDQLVQEGVAEGGLPDRTSVLYVSPLKALSNDIHVNLEQPLVGISAELQALGLPPLEIRTAVRTGDTPQAERAAMRKRVPHILVTTPESLYVLLGSESGRQMLGHVRSVIVDEIHAIAGNKRGSHLALSLERLEALCGQPLVRVGLSATQKPIEAVADFLVGAGRDCEIIDVGHGRARDLALEVPPVPLEAVMSNDVWELVYDRLAVLAGEHRTTLVFVNTRRMAERAARHLSERLGNTVVAAHHGSLAREQRLDAEQRLKRGELRVLVATASLELGIDIGDVELVCQLGSPRSISAFLQRVGRAGHQVGGISKGRLFPSSRDDLIECAALLDAVRRGELDTLVIPTAPLDVLAQQIVAEVSCREWQEDALFALIRRAMPYAGLSEADYQALLAMLAEGYTTRHGARGAYLHRDLVNRTLTSASTLQVTMQLDLTVYFQARYSSAGLGCAPGSSTGTATLTLSNLLVDGDLEFGVDPAGGGLEISAGVDDISASAETFSTQGFNAGASQHLESLHESIDDFMQNELGSEATRLLEVAADGPRAARSVPACRPGW